MQALFRVAAGPALGFGHLRRAVSLAVALGAEPVVSVRGNRLAQGAAGRLGCRVMSGSAAAALARVMPAVLVIDDPNATAARVWLRAARERRIPVASVHDLGIAWIESDLLIDGSFTKSNRVAPDQITRATRLLHGPRREGQGNDPRFLLGPGYMPLDPDLGTYRRAAQDGGPPRVLIALGGGPRRRHALALARAIRREQPDVLIRIAGGFTGQSRPDPGIVWLPALPTLGEELAAATVAIVAGGVTLYEACCLGVPSVAVAVSTLSAQRHTVRAAAALGVTRAAGALGDPGTPARVANRVRELLNGPKLRMDLAAAGRRVVDGRGAPRVARALGHLARNQQ